ncbi:AlpA family transcriptional regulator [Microbulbifer salipaludis]|uniref:AlpA family transcriptional regulator n=2 Tax=Microbulbifer salipaludis TaxID=187980 RepID=A0ABS3E946_9GAMM|nr:AlpA family transcriptional regulator [Microbulbifer salipaludis]
MGSTTSKPAFLRMPQVQDQTGLKKTYIYHLVSTGQFPAPIKLGKRAVAWLSEDIDNWIKERITNSQPPEPVTPNPVETAPLSFLDKRELKDIADELNRIRSEAKNAATLCEQDLYWIAEAEFQIFRIAKNIAGE